MPYLLLIISLGLIAFKPSAQSLLDQYIQQSSFKEIFYNSDDFQLEILLTEIIETDTSTEFVVHHFGKSDDYYYPASTVKLPLALSIFQNLSPKKGEIAVLQETQVCGSYNYPDSIDVLRNVEKMLIYSDNPSYNYLYELVGATGINQTLRRLELDGQVIRRLLLCKKSYWRKHADYIWRDSLISGSKYKTAFRLPMKAKLGDAHYYGSDFKKKARNFRRHNYLPIRTNHTILGKLLFSPNSLNIDSTSRDHLINYLLASPRNLGDTSKHDNYTKYFYLGKDSSNIPENILIVNNVGKAYGYLIDHAYIADLSNKRQFLLSARINVNANNILGDDIYEYDNIGLPLFRELSRWCLNNVAVSDKMGVAQEIYSKKKAATQ